MVRRSVLWFFVLVVACGLGWVANAAETAAPTTTEQPAPAAPIENPPMTLQTDGALPETFRGGNPDSSCVHVLEDEKYKRQEHTILYDDSAAALPGAGTDAKFEGPPTINWTTNRVNEDGTTTPISNENTNSATNESMFPEPGQYTVGNGGARQVSGGSQDTSGAGGGATQAGNGGGGTDNGAGGGAQQPGNGGGGTDNGAGGGANQNANNGGGADNGAGAGANQRVTANTTQGVQAHDCTAPNLCGVIKEFVSDKDEKPDPEALRKALRENIVGALVALTQKDAPVPEGLKACSLLGVQEFPKNVKPADKTAKVAAKGSLFDKDGNPTLIAPEQPVKMGLLDRDKQTRGTLVGANTLGEGIFVRQNIPFLMAADLTDNGKWNREAGAECYIFDKTNNKKIELVEGAYLFRVPNYPRAEYKDQPEYEFVMKAADEAGNRTEVHVPLNVVSTKAAFEAGQTR